MGWCKHKNYNESVRTIKEGIGLIESAAINLFRQGNPERDQTDAKKDKPILKERVMPSTTELH